MPGASWWKRSMRLTREWCMSVIRWAACSKRSGQMALRCNTAGAATTKSSPSRSVAAPSTPQPMQPTETEAPPPPMPMDIKEEPAVQVQAKHGPISLSHKILAAQRKLRELGTEPSAISTQYIQDVPEAVTMLDLYVTSTLSNMISQFQLGTSSNSQHNLLQEMDINFKLV